VTPHGSARRILISCGEASGDQYAAALVQAMQAIEPDVSVMGFGGARLARAGAELVGDYRKFAVTGIADALAVVPRALRMRRTLIDVARARRPDAFVAIDFPDFNFRVLPAMRRLGVPIVYYVSPQLWAWRRGRIKHLRRYVDRMLVIFPFEEALYVDAGIPVEFVGHPLVDLIPPSPPRAEWLGARGLSADAPVVALLPGSRPNEIHRLLPILLDAASEMRRTLPRAQFVIARAPALDDELFTNAAATPGVVVVAEAANDVLASADVVITASGTATVQTALHGRPMVIVYRVSAVDAAIGRMVLTLSTFGMVNLIAGRRIVPELMQEDCTPANVAREAISLLTDDARAESMRRDLSDVRARLGRSGASARAAAAVLRTAHGEVAEPGAGVKY
jgi:lipid-A-disaccharide synthase